MLDFIYAIDRQLSSQYYTKIKSRIRRLVLELSAIQDCDAHGLHNGVLRYGIRISIIRSGIK